LLDDEEGQSTVRRTRTLSHVEVEGLKDLLGHSDDDEPSVIEEEPEMYSDMDNDNEMVQHV
jgi:hypothetical protein